MSAILIVKARVTSYDSWRTSYDAKVTFRREHGASDVEIYCAPEDMTSVLVLHFFDSIGAARSFAANPALTEAFHEGGVIGTPHLTIVETV